MDFLTVTKDGDHLTLVWDEDVPYPQEALPDMTQKIAAVLEAPKVEQVDDYTFYLSRG